MTHEVIRADCSFLKLRRPAREKCLLVNWLLALKHFSSHNALVHVVDKVVVMQRSAVIDHVKVTHSLYQGGGSPQAARLE